MTSGSEASGGRQVGCSASEGIVGAPASVAGTRHVIGSLADEELLKMFLSYERILEGKRRHTGALDEGLKTDSAGLNCDET